MVSTMDVTCFYVSVMAAFVVPGRAFQGNISITGNPELGGNATITCSWTLAAYEHLFSVLLRSFPIAPSIPNYYYYLFNQGFTWAVPGNQRHSRVSFENFNSNDNRAIVRITNVQRSDERNYSCYFTIGRWHSQNTYHERASALTVNIPVRDFQASISITGNTEEGGNVTITCNWTLASDEVLLNVQLRSLPVVRNDPNYYYYQFSPGFTWASPGSQKNSSSMSFERFNSSSNQAVVRITNVQCSDERNYSCYFTIGRWHSQNTYHERTSALTVKCRAFQASISITGNTEIGGNATITCNWTLASNEILLNVQLRSLPVVPSDPNYYYYQFSPVFTWASPGSQKNSSRISFERFNSSNNRAIVRITNVQCSDERNYSCYFTIGRWHSQNTYHERATALKVKFRALPVKLTSTARRMFAQLNIWTQDQDVLRATCSADMDQVGAGWIEWVVFSRCVPEYINRSDSRITSDTYRSAACSQRVDETLTLNNVGRRQDLLVVCFVLNAEHLRSGSTPGFCTNSSDIPCMESPNIWVVAGPAFPQASQGEGSPLDWWQDIFVFLVGSFIGLILSLTLFTALDSKSRTPSVQGNASSDEMSQGHEGKQSGQMETFISETSQETFQVEETTPRSGV